MTLRRVACALAASLLAVLLGGAARDPGLVLEIDRAAFTLDATDARDGARHPPLRVALGAPSTPTPAGRFRPAGVVLSPAWRPGPRARAAGARPRSPSDDGPMGIAKLPFARGGEIALHGGAEAVVLGKPISSGCVRATDADLGALLRWMDERGALGPARAHEGEAVRAFRRPVQVVVR